MAYRQSNPMKIRAQLDTFEQTSTNEESKHNKFYTCKWNWKCRLENGSHFVVPINPILQSYPYSTGLFRYYYGNHMITCPLCGNSQVTDGAPSLRARALIQYKDVILPE